MLGKVLHNKNDVDEAKFHCAMDLKGFDYWTMPVDIKEFVLSPAYLDLERTIRPEVLKDLQELFCDKSSFAFCPYEEALSR